MATKLIASSLLLTILLSTAMPPLHACGYCDQPPTHTNPPKHTHPPAYKKPPKSSSHPKIPPIVQPPIVGPPVVRPPIVGPPVVVTPPVLNPPVGGGVPSTNPTPTSPANCPINTLKLGLCVDVLGGLVHAGVGDPVVNTCCPVLGGLLELEAAVCLCTTLRIRLLNINIVIPLTIQALISCGKNMPPDFTCPS